MIKDYLETVVYPDIPFSDQIGVPKETRILLKKEYGIEISHYLPGILLERKLQSCDIEDHDRIYSKLIQSCRKLCMMWYAGEQALEAERDFYSTTIQDAPALFGEDAIKVNYHLESFVLIARSSLDISANIFGSLLPHPFKKGRYDSFNKLIKQLLKDESRLDISDYFEKMRNDQCSWLSIVSGHERGRSLRDKIAHQTEFPIDYAELNPNSEKESPIVYIDKDEWQRLDEFVRKLSSGVIEGFMELEALCCENIEP